MIFGTVFKKLTRKAQKLPESTPTNNFSRKKNQDGSSQASMDSKN